MREENGYKIDRVMALKLNKGKKGYKAYAYDEDELATGFDEFLGYLSAWWANERGKK